MSTPPVAAIEIGTSNVVALVGEIRPDGALQITGLGKVKSKGIRKSGITDYELALECVRSAVKMAENQAETDIRQAHLVLSGAHTRSEVHSGVVHILNADREVTQNEVTQVRDVVRKSNLPPDRECVHTIDQLYRLDDRPGVLSAMGQVGERLSLDMLMIHSLRSEVDNLTKVIQDLPLDVVDVGFAGLLAALAVLTPDQKKSGVAVIDFGGGTTKVAAYANETLALAQTLAIGGDHITNDIALGLNIPNLQAERLKIESGSALNEPGDRAGTLSLPPEGGFSSRKIQEKDLRTIVHARADETLELVREILGGRELLGRMGAGLILTGRGAKLKNLAGLAERIFNMPCSIGYPRDIGGMRELTEGPDYASVVGMMKYAARAPQSRPASLKGLWKKLLSGERD
jgi:cell division protein FtsA